jgi:hypothetical protein
MDFRPRFHTLTRCLVERGLFLSQPLTLIDVGCGSGIPDIWRHFEPSLRGLGVDPQIDECRRLQALETNQALRYVPAFLRLPESHPFRRQRGSREPWTGNPWERTSAAHAMRILADQVAAEQQFTVLNAWDKTELVPPSQTLSLDELVRQQNLGNVDFIKIDVDGPDLEVLLSSEQTITQSPVLGVVLEVNFSGSADPTDHSFHNMDRQMRTWGFELFDLTTRRCSSAALPATFRCDGAPHETLLGRIVQGDALYLRDPCGWNNHPAARVALSPVQLLKLACLLELFNLPDQAAELLRDFAEEVAPIAEAKPLLHLLANEMDPRLESYDTYLQGFRDDPTSFYPSQRPAP